MIRVVIESPYAAPAGTSPDAAPAIIERNLRYLRACMADCFARGEAPFASHGLYTQPGVLRDEVPEERELGITAGFLWRDAAEKTVVYTDLGMSGGMKYGVADAEKKGRPIEERELGPEWDMPPRTCPHCLAGESSVWDSVFDHYAHPDLENVGKLKFCHEPWRARQ